jgi:NADH dehydrogenase (ubiquinone) flavoprotein 2
MIRGGYEVLEAIKAKLGIDVGGDTSDGVFHLMEAECLGACVNAPMVQINDDFYEDLTPATVGAVLDGIKAGTPRKIGPQNGRNGCEGPMGRTTLAADFVPKPYCRDLTPPPAADGPAKK